MQWEAMSLLAAAAALCASAAFGAAVLPHNPEEQLHRQCSVPEDKSDYHLAENWCTACYMETLMGLTNLPGSDMVIGANDGISFDPAWHFGYWKKSPDHTIVWVEPNPALFAKLSKNTEIVPKRVLLNKAVRPLTMTGSELTLFCWNVTMVEEVLAGRMKSPLPPEVGEVKPHWNALCSLDMANLEEAADVWKTPQMNALPLDRATAIKESVRANHVIRHTVAARTPAELMADAGVSSVRYLQIDVEGLDNSIIRSLPLGENGFSPNLILYENHQGYDVKGWLEDRGYFVCCCLKQWGSNIVAVKVPPKLTSNFTKSEYRPDRRFHYNVPDRAAMDALLEKGSR